MVDTRLKNTLLRPRVLHVGPLPPPLGGMPCNVEKYLSSEVSEAFEIIHVRSNQIRKDLGGTVLQTVLKPVNLGVLLAVFLWRLMTSGCSLVHIRTSSFAGFYEKSILGVLAGLAGRKVIMHVHGGAFGDFFEKSSAIGKWAIRRLLGFNTMVIALSPEMKSMLGRIGLPAQKIAIIENAVFLPAKTVWDHKAGSGPVRILFLNRIDLQKGLEELLEAMKIVHARSADVQCIIHGPPSNDSVVLESSISRLGLNGVVQLLPPVSGVAKEEAYLNSDIYVLPSHVEGMPNGLLEAMSYGLPSVVTPVGGVPGVIRDGCDAVLVPIKAPEALADALLRLIADKSLRENVGREARRTMEQRFDWRHSARGIIALYWEVLETGSRPTGTAGNGVSIIARKNR